MSPTADRPLGVVLAGGASRRMGTDKAAVLVGGRPMVAGPARALAAHGLEVVLVGGDPTMAVELGVGFRADRRSGQGPVVALANLSPLERDVVVLPCDLPDVDADALRALLSDGAPRWGRMAVRSGRPAHPAGWWSAGLLRHVAELVDAGARSFTEVLGDDERLEWVAVDARFDDADHPGDLERLGYPPAP